jgi:hypothetical protein
VPCAAGDGGASAKIAAFARFDERAEHQHTPVCTCGVGFQPTASFAVNDRSTRLKSTTVFRTPIAIGLVAVIAYFASVEATVATAGSRAVGSAQRSGIECLDGDGL